MTLLTLLCLSRFTVAQLYDELFIGVLKTMELCIMRSKQENDYPKSQDRKIGGHERYKKE